MKGAEGERHRIPVAWSFGLTYSTGYGESSVARAAPQSAPETTRAGIPGAATYPASYEAMIARRLVCLLVLTAAVAVAAHGTQAAS